MARTAAEILASARTALRDAQQGFEDLTGDTPQRRLTGLRNVAVFGRSVTWVLQNLRGVDKERFDSWYAPYEQEMRDDSLMRYFIDLRNKIEKQGSPEVSNSTSIAYLDMRDLAPLMNNPPSGARHFFVGDTNGGSGWEVALPDGRVEKFYVTLPEAVSMTFNFRLPDPPNQHMGEPLHDPTAEQMCGRYLSYLSGLLDAAEGEFSK